jgi:hypothetical protein
VPASLPIHSLTAKTRHILEVDSVYESKDFHDERARCDTRLTPRSSLGSTVPWLNLKEEHVMLVVLFPAMLDP